jgi:large repetitive protein
MNNYCYQSGRKLDFLPTLSVKLLFFNSKPKIMKNNFLQSFLMGLLFLLGGQVLSAQPANDACASSIALTPAAVPAITAGTSVAATSSGVPISSCSGFVSTSALDVWYNFTAVASTSYTVRLTSAFDGIVAVYSGTCAAPVFVGCVDAVGSNATESLALGLLPPGNYLTRVYGWAGATGTFSISVVGATPPVNDACANATVLTPAAVPAITAGTNVNATSSGVAIPAACSSTSALDVWYSFTATGSNAYVVNLTSAAIDGVIAVYSGACAAPVFISCADAAGLGGAESLSLGQLAAGSYLVRVYGWNGGTGAFNVSVVAGSPLPPANDACSGAIVLNPAAVPVLIPGTSANATASSTPIPACSGATSSGALDVWYSFTAVASTNYTVNLTATALDGVVAVYSGNCAAPSFVSCVDAGFAGGAENLPLMGLTAGSYFVRVYGWAGATGTFNVGVTALPCSITVQCPSSPTGTFNCTTPIPAPVTTVAAFNALGASIGGTPCGTVVISAATAAPNLCAGGPVVRTYTIFDDTNNNGVANIGEQSFTCPLTYNYVGDIIPPVITCPVAPPAVSCAANLPAGLPFTGTATDNCGGTPVVTFVDGPQTLATCANRFSINRTYTATDACNRTATCSVAIVVNDQIAPTITCPANINFVCASAIPPPTPLTVVATDNCTGAATVTFVNDVNTNSICANKYSVTRTYRATDLCGNAATCAQIIAINDNVPPTLTCPPNSTLACTSLIPPSLPFLGTAVDNCTGGVIVTAGIEQSFPGTCFDPLTKIRTFIATDACGNAATCQQTIKIAPQLVTQPANLTLDACFNDQDYLNWLNNRGGATFSCNSTFLWQREEYDYVLLSCPQLRGWKVRFTGTDPSGAVICFSANVTVVEEGAPIWDMLPMNKTVNCNDVNANASISMWLANAGDAWLLDCGTLLSQLVVTNNYTAAAPICGSRVVVFTATDLCGNSSTASATLTRTDNIPPVISNVPANTTITCPETPSFGTPTATDACGAATLTFTDVTTGGPCPLMYMVVRTWVATDACGNTSTKTAKITVNAVTNPNPTGVLTFNCLNNQTVTAASNTSSVVVNYTAPIGTSTCTVGAVSVVRTSGLASGSSFPIGVSTIVHTATDGCGNTKTCSFTITVNANNPTPTGVLTFNCLNNQTVTAASNTSSVVVNYTAPIGTSTCTVGAVSVVRTSGLASGSSFPIGVSTIVHTATDGCGNTKTCSFTITVNANNPTPTGVLTLNCGVNQVANAATGANSAVVNFANPIATSTCTTGSVSTTQTSGLTSGSAFPVGVSTVIFTSNDGCGNTKTCSFTVTVNAINNPNPSILTLNVPPNQNLGCGQTAVFGNATASSTCTTGSSNVTFVDVTTGSVCSGITATRTFTATDGCGNTKTGQQVISIVGDASAPTFATVPNNSTVACGAAINFGTATATDVCGSAVTNVPVTFADLAATGSCSTGYTYRRVFTATDACGKTATSVQTISTSPDNTPPVFTSLPAQDLMIGCNVPVNVGAATASDACSPAGVIVTQTTATNGPTACTTVNGITYGYDVYTTWKATDVCGNTTTTVTNVWVIPNGMAFLDVPVNKSATCGQNLVFDTPPMVKSTFGPVMTTSFEDIMDVNACGAGTASRLWTATDDQGNTAQAMQVITLMPDTELPQIFLSEPTITINCDEFAALSAPVVADNCASVDQILVEYSEVKNGNTYTRTWSATDLCGNKNEAIQTINTTDNQAPEFSFVPADETLYCGATANYTPAIASDNCAQQVNVDFIDVKIGNITTRTWSATDAFGNKKEAIQTITHVPDAAPEFVTNLTNKSVSCADLLVFDAPLAIDDCGAVALSFIDNVNYETCQSLHTRTWVAMDIAGNTKTMQQTIAFVDDIAPDFTFVPANETLQCGENQSNTTPTAIDNCNPNSQVIITFSEETIDNVTTRTWAATDACGNRKEAIQTITNVLDVIAPEFTSTPINKVITCDESPIFDILLANDACSAVNLTFVDEITNNVCEQIHTRKWTATDANGNQKTMEQIITVKDDIAPSFSFVPSNQEQNCAIGIQFGTPIAKDICSNVVITLEDAMSAPQVCGNSGQTYTRTWTAMDECGNKTIASQDIHILEDVTAPQFTEQMSNLELTQEEFVSWQPNSPTTSDNCNETVEVTSNVIAVDECNHKVTYTATDLCGNTVLQVQNIHITDGVCAPSGTNNLENGNIKIYPNPAADVLFVASSNNAIAIGTRYEVIDNLGRILVIGEISSNLTNLNISKLPASHYTLRIYQAKKPIVLMFEKI